MNCQEFLRLLDADGHGDRGDAAAHVASCAACRHALERSRAVMRELRAMGEEPLPPFLHSRLMAHVRAERDAAPQAHRLWASRMRWLAPLFVASGVALVVGYGVWNAPGPLARRESAAPVVAQGPKAAATPKPMIAVGGYARHDDASAPSAPAEAETARERFAVKSAPAKREGRLSDERRRFSRREEAYAPEPEALADVDAGRVAAQNEELINRAPKSRAAQESGIASFEDEEKRRASGSADDQIGIPPAPMAPDRVATRKATSSEFARHKETVGKRRSIVCTLAPMDAAVVSRPIELPADLAPPAGTTWIIAISRDGETTITPVADIAEEGAAVAGPLGGEEKGARDKVLQLKAGDAGTRLFIPLTPELVDCLRDLPPGRYRLRREAVDR